MWIRMWECLARFRRVGDRRGATSHKILIGDGRAEPVVVGDELADELMQAGLEDLVHAAVFDARADGAGEPLGRPLTAVGARDQVEVTDQVLVAACLLYTSDAADERSSVDL